ncbi:copper-binding protein, partial [Pseudomonas neuropathica]
MTYFKQRSMKVIALALLSLGGSALAAVQPVTSLPLKQDAGQRWHLPAGEYRGSFSVDQTMQIVCEPGAVFRGEGQG